MGNSVGYWQSCSGCTESVEGYVSSRDYPPHPKHGVPTGCGCSECKGKGVVFVHWTKAMAESFDQFCRDEVRKMSKST